MIQGGRGRAAIFGIARLSLATMSMLSLLGCRSMGATKSPGYGSSPGGFRIVRLDGRESGPTLLIVAGIHGDESSGPEAAEFLAAGRPPARGTLVIVPAACLEALAVGQRWAPGWSDLNRAFIASGPHETQDRTAARAAEILAFIEAERPDLLLDLHESDRNWSEGDAPALVVPLSTAANELALALLESPALAGFSFTGPPPAGSLVAAVDGRLAIPALLVEVPDALDEADRVAVFLALVETAMDILGMGARTEVPQDVSAARQSSRP